MSSVAYSPFTPRFGSNWFQNRINSLGLVTRGAAGRRGRSQPPVLVSDKRTSQALIGKHCAIPDD
jgi:hypothetical protein